jgi:hypothetical protein
MTTIRLRHAMVLAGLAALTALGGGGPALAQASGSTAAPPDAGDMPDMDQEAMPGCMVPGWTMPGRMMGRNMMMGRGMMAQDHMMGGMPMAGMHGHMMQIMFAIADTDGDGALSFDEVMAVHKRIFNVIDANKDGKVTLEEMQAFMRP